MGTHTGGPWESDAEGYVYDRTGTCLGRCETPDMPEGEWRANARLMAAAPSLLVALRKALLLCEAAGHDPGGLHRPLWAALELATKGGA